MQVVLYSILVVPVAPMTIFSLKPVALSVSQAVCVLERQLVACPACILCPHHAYHTVCVLMARPPPGVFGCTTAAMLYCWRGGVVLWLFRWVVLSPLLFSTLGTGLPATWQSDLCTFSRLFKLHVCASSVVWHHTLCVGDRGPGHLQCRQLFACVCNTGLLQCKMGTTAVACSV